MALINCIECGKEISDKAVACPNCGVPLNISMVESDVKQSFIKISNTDTEQKIEKERLAKQESSDKGIGWFVIIVVIISIVVLLRGCSGDEASVEAAPAAVEEAVPAATEEVAAVAAKPLAWSYLNDVDKMSGKETKLAYTTSINTEQLGFPYNGGTTMDINVRKHPRMGTDVYITVNKGQLNHEYDGDSIMVKFDNEKAHRYTVNEPSDNSRDTFFIQGSKKFIAKLKNSKKVIIEVEFYNNGNHQFEFNTEDLQWK